MTCWLAVTLLNATWCGIASLVRCPQPISRISSPYFGVLVTLTKAEARLPVSASVLSRSEYDERIQFADSRPLRRSGTSGPLMKRLARAPEFSRAIVGGVAVALPAFTT